MTKKKLVFAVIMVMLLTMLFAVACDQTKTDNLDKAFELMSKADNLKVTVSADDKVLYVYDNGIVTDEYNLGIDHKKLLGEKTADGLTLKKADLQSGYEFAYDESSSEATLKGGFANAKELLGIDCDNVSLSVKANLSNNTISEYTISYTSKNGYDIVISLA